MQSKHISEIAAREAAFKFGNQQVTIIESKADGYSDPGPWVFYVESGQPIMVRSWEREVYSGKGRDALPNAKKKLKPTTAQVNNMNAKILGNFFAKL